MPVEHEEHAIISDYRNIRGYGPDASHQQIYEAEARALAMLSPRDRACSLREFEIRVANYNKNQGHGLRQQAQAHRFESYLRNADLKLRAAGR